MSAPGRFPNLWEIDSRSHGAALNRYRGRSQIWCIQADGLTTNRSADRGLQDGPRVRRSAPVGMQLVDLPQDGVVFLLGLHFDDHGQHPKPHGRIGDEPNRGGHQDRKNRCGEKVSQADVSQGASEDDLGRDRRCGEERDEPEAFHPPIVNRRLREMEQAVVPSGKPCAEGHGPPSIPSL